MYLDDLNYMLEELEKNHLFLYFAHTKEEVNAYKEKLLSEYKINSPEDFAYVASLLIAYISDIYDQHTGILAKPIMTPYKYKFIENKLYMFLNKEDKSYRYITKINGIDINTILEEYSKIIPTFTEERLKFYLESARWGFSNLFNLKMLPSIDSTCESIDIELNDGSIQSIDFEGIEVTYKKGNVISLDYVNNIPVINYNTCLYKDEVEEFAKKHAETNFDNVIVDLRGNGGGNSNNIKPILELVKDKNICILTDESVYSAGIFSIYQLKKVSKNVTCIGTKVGAPLNGFGNTYNPIILPDVGLRVDFSIKYFDLDPFYGDVDFVAIRRPIDFKVTLENHPELTQIRYYKPDIYIKPTLDDYKTGNDPVLNKAIEVIESYKLDSIKYA